MGHGIKAHSLGHFFHRIQFVFEKEVGMLQFFGPDTGGRRLTVFFGKLPFKGRQASPGDFGEVMYGQIFQIKGIHHIIQVYFFSAKVFQEELPEVPFRVGIDQVQQQLLGFEAEEVLKVAGLGPEIGQYRLHEFFKGFICGQLKHPGGRLPGRALLQDTGILADKFPNQVTVNKKYEAFVAGIGGLGIEVVSFSDKEEVAFFYLELRLFRPEDLVSLQDVDYRVFFKEDLVTEGIEVTSERHKGVFPEFQGFKRLGRYFGRNSKHALSY